MKRSSGKGKGKSVGNKKIEAYGVKGMKNTQWRKTFPSREALNKWVDKNDAEVHGTRGLNESVLQRGSRIIRLVERALYDEPIDNPLAKTTNKGDNDLIVAKGNGFDKPFGKMAVPFGAYSLARNVFATGSPTVTDRRDG